MDEKITASNSELALLVQEVTSALETARQNVVTQVNAELLNTYWSIGRIICEHEQSSPDRADYGKQTLKELSKALTKEFGKGFSVSNMQFMRRFYQAYQIQQTVSVKLSWSHYTDKDSITAEYALGGLENNIFASRYVLYMPNKDQLIAQVEAVLEKWHEKK